MIQDSAKIAALLSHEFAFRGLSREQLVLLAEGFESITLEKDQIYLTARKPVENFYILFDGRLQIEYLESRKKPLVTILEFGDSFGEEVLVNDTPPAMTVTALEKSEVLVLAPERFEEIGRQMPDQIEEIKRAFKITANSRSIARAKRFTWLRDDESVFFISRKHQFFLFRSMIVPIILFILSIPVLTIGLAEAGVSSFGLFMLLGGLAMSILGFAGILWNWLDWTNDYYLVTKLRVVWIEKVVLLYDSRDESTLINVLATNVNTTWFGRLLDYGDVSARTFTGSIPLNKTSQPYVLAAYIDGLRFRAQEIHEEMQDKEMEQALAEALRKRHENEGRVIISDARPVRPMSAPKKTPAPITQGFRASLQNILKVRFEQAGVITYRKHWMVLLGKCWLPLLLSVLWLVGAIAVLSSDLAGMGPVWLSLLFLTGIGILIWLAYNFQDWRNDIYQLTPTQIFDIEKKPLGTEIKNSADLSNILTITHERRNLLHIIFNYGNVVITVGETLFTFMGVYNPDRVHQDITNYQEALRLRKRQVEDARERERMINWLVAYHTETDQAEHPGAAI